MLLGYKGLITNVILIGLGYFLAPWFLGFQSTARLTLPVPILALLALLLVAERKTNLNVLAVEFSALQDVHHQRWKRFMSRDWYFGLLLLMSVIWRSYFRLILIVFPLLNWVYDSMDIRYDALPWYGRMPYWLCGLLVAAQQATALIAERAGTAEFKSLARSRTGIPGVRPDPADFFYQASFICCSKAF